MSRKNIQSHIESLVVLLLFGVFAVCAVTVLLTGARAYEGLTRRDQTSFDIRTCTQYVATRLRQRDQAGAVSVEEFAGVPSLCLAESIGGETYVTRIYCCDGVLRELFAAEGDELDPQAGEAVMELESLSFQQEGELLRIEAAASGETRQLVLSLRSDQDRPLCREGGLEEIEEIEEIGEIEALGLGEEGALG